MRRLTQPAIPVSLRGLEHVAEVPTKVSKRQHALAAEVDRAQT